jgi:AcrR family transcriptional regulator
VATVARKKVELRREEILEATVEQIKKRGIVATRVTDVASALGVSSGLVFYHFEGKDQLLEEAFAYAVRRDLAALDAICARDAPALDRLKAALRLYGPTGKAPGWLLWVDGWAASLRDPGLRRVIRGLDTRWRRAIEQLIAEGAAAGEFQCDDPRGAAWRITALLDGLAVQLIVRKTGLTKSETTAWVSALVASELGLEAEQLAPPTGD